MATSPSPASFFVRLDPRLREGLQQQIYGSVRRAILEGVLTPGTRLPSSRALATDLGVSRTTTLLAVQQLQAEGYLTARRGSGTSVAAELPDDLVERSGARPASRPKHPALSRRGAAVAAVPGGRAAPRRPAPGVSSRHARRGPVPGRPLVAAGQPPAALGDVGPARLRRSGGPPGPARGHREPRPDGPGHALRGRPGGHGGRRPAGLRARLPPLAGSGRPRVDGGAGLSRSPERPPGGGRADRSRAPWMPRGWTSPWGPAAPVTPASPT